MKDLKIFPSEYRFCQVLWGNEPVASTQLVFLCRDKLNWSKSTTYTVIRRLQERGILRRENAICYSLVSKESVQLSLVTELINNYFDSCKEFQNIAEQIIEDNVNLLSQME